MSDLGQEIAASAERRGTATALEYETTSLSYGGLLRDADRVSRDLQSVGVRPGDRVAVGLPNSVDLVVTVLGVLRCGAILVPLNPACTAEEARYIVGDSQARFARVAAGLADHLRCNPGVEVWDEEVPRGSHSGAAGVAQVAGAAPALIVYTSGTTGRPKGAVLSHDALVRNLRTVADAWRWTERDRLLLTVPCFHVHGLGLGVFASLLVGSTILLRRRFVAEETLRDLERSEATMFFGVPTMYNRLVALPAEQGCDVDLRRMRLWVCGSAPLSATTFERFRERFGVEILERFGMTECGFVLAAPFDGPRQGGIVGRPLPDVEVLVVDSNRADGGALREVPPGESGELLLRGPGLFSGYWRKPEETRRAFLAGYFRTGDLAVQEKGGLYRIVGRRSVDIIKTRGFKVSAVEIEDCLQRCPGVQEVAVVGLPDDDQGERVVAAVTRMPGANVSEEKLREQATAQLAPHKVPSAYVFVKEIPRTGPGKFKKKELIRLLDRRAAGA